MLAFYFVSEEWLVERISAKPPLNTSSAEWLVERFSAKPPPVLFFTLENLFDRYFDLEFLYQKYLYQ